MSVRPALPDLVHDSRLETSFHDTSIDALHGPIVTSHVFVDSGLDPSQRAVRQRQYWRREKLIARGSYGDVWLERLVDRRIGSHWKGEQQDEDQVRAVKQIRRSKGHGVEVYHRELESMAKFSHRNYRRCFVESFGWYEWRDSICLSMEYLPHGDMEEYLQTSKLSESETQEVTFQLLEGLSFMHKNGFVHRDVKPNNILIKSRPPDHIWWVKIGDFGISRRVDEFSPPSSLKGTWGFIAPELHDLVKGLRPLGSSDMWSLGETIHRFLTNAPCFPKFNDLLSFAREDQPLPTGLLKRNDVGPSGVDFLQALMAVRPSDRPTSQAALGHEWLSGRRSLKDDRSSSSSVLANLMSQENLDETLVQPLDSLSGYSAEWTGVTDLPDIPSDLNATVRAMEPSVKASSIWDLTAGRFPVGSSTDISSLKVLRDGTKVAGIIWRQPFVKSLLPNLSWSDLSSLPLSNESMPLMTSLVVSPNSDRVLWRSSVRKELQSYSISQKTLTSIQVGDITGFGPSSMDVSSDGQILAALHGSPNTCCIFDASNGRLLHGTPVPFHPSQRWPSENLKCSPVAPIVAIGGGVSHNADKSFHIHTVDLRTGKGRDESSTRSGPFDFDKWGAKKSLSFSPDGSHIVVGIMKDVFLLDRRSRREAAKVSVPENANVYTAEMSPDGHTLAVGTQCISLWDLRTLKGRTMLSWHTDTGERVNQQGSIVFSPTGRKLATTTRTNSSVGLVTWDVD